MQTHSLSIAKLKGVKDLPAIKLDEKSITGIFGPNGVGKSTILHALAAAYSAPQAAKSHDFKTFFPKLVDDVWNGSNFEIEHTIKTPASEGTEITNYRKGIATTLWKPVGSRRPTREVCYVAIKSVVPSLERHSQHNLSISTSATVSDPATVAALKAASSILGIPYQSLSKISAPAHPNRDYYSIARSDLGGRDLIDVTLGAGEQRLLELLQAIHRTRKFALILIDEIDLLLHGKALVGLFTHLDKHCRKNQKQLVFTSHREEILSLGNLLNVVHIHKGVDHHVCLPSTDVDSIHRLTGKRSKKLEVFVEDLLAETVVNHVACGLGLGRHVSVCKFGDATNAFTVSAGLLLSGQSCKNSLFLIDGDVYRSNEEKRIHINKACSGNDRRATTARGKMTAIIRDFTLPEDTRPEKYLHHLVSEIAANTLTDQEREIQNLASDIIVPENTHDYIDAIVEAFGGEAAVRLDHIVKLAAKHSEWDGYVAPLKDWLTEKKAELSLQ